MLGGLVGAPPWSIGQSLVLPELPRGQPSPTQCLAQVCCSPTRAALGSTLANLMPHLCPNPKGKMFSRTATILLERTGSEEDKTQWSGARFRVEDLSSDPCSIMLDV